MSGHRITATFLFTACYTISSQAADLEWACPWFTFIHSFV